MSVVGFDVGNESCVVGVARQRGIDVVLNEESKRETPAMVSFGDKQRFLGTAAAGSATMNPKNTISQIKQLIGRNFRDPEVQRTLQMLPFNVVQGPDGTPLINVEYLGETRSYTPTQLLGMVLSNLKSIAEKNLGTHVVDCVIGVPVFFTELQRRAVLHAAKIAKLHPLRLMHETTATALAYGIYRTDLPENDPIHVVFVDMGHASMQVCVVAFKKGHLQVLAHSFDRCLGGRDFDEVLFNHFAAKFKEEYKIDVVTNVRASQRLRTACEKLKKVLSANPEAPINIECLMDEKDVRGFIKREEFEKLAAPILDRIKAPLQKALDESGLSLDKINSVEVVGSGSRIPAVIRIITTTFNREPKRSLNASESVARGCALQCAMLSPTFRVKEFQVQDAFPFPVALSWKGSAPEVEDGVEETHAKDIVFKKGNAIPSTKVLTFFRSGTFTIDALYADPRDLPPGTPAKISTFTIGPFTSKVERPKIKVKIRLNLHGIISVESATLYEEEDVEIPVPTKETTAMETDKDEKGPLEDKDVKMEGANGAEPSPTVDHSEANATKMECDPIKPEPTKKKKTKKIDVAVGEAIFGGLSDSALEKAVEHEYELALQDRVMEETKDKKNALEAYVYDTRNKIYEKLQDYITDVERTELMQRLQETEDWLYEEGEDQTKGVYIEKLADLKKLGDPIEERHKEAEARHPAIEQLLYCVNSFREAASSKDAKYDHIDVAEKDKVIVECNKAEEWLADKRRQQDALPLSANPVLVSGDIRKKAEVLDRFCKPIMTKPKPAPPKAPPAQTPEPKTAEKKDKTGFPGGDVPGGTEAPSEAMDTDATGEDADRMQTDT